MSVLSQDTFVIPGVVVSNAGGGGGGGGGVSQIVAGGNIILSPGGGTGVVTIDTSPGPIFSTIQMGLTPGGTIGGVTDLNVSSINGQLPNSAIIPAQIGVSTISIYNTAIGNSTITFRNPVNNRIATVSNTSSGLYIAQSDTTGTAISGAIEIGNVGTVGGESIAFKIGLASDANTVQISNAGFVTSSISVSSINGQIPGGGTYSYPAVVSVSTLNVNNTTGGGLTETNGIILTNAANSRKLTVSPVSSLTLFIETNSAGTGDEVIMGMGDIGGKVGMFILAGNDAANRIEIDNTGFATSSITVSSINGASAVALSAINSIDFVALVSTVAGLSPP